MGGVNRFNTNFLIKSPEPIVSTATCGFEKPVSEVRIFTSDLRTEKTTFGVDESGNPVSDGSCAYGYKIKWPRYIGGAGMVVISY